MLCWILLSVTSLKRLTRWSSFSIQTSNQIFRYHENINCLLLKFFNSIIPTKYNLRLSFPCSILNWILPNPLMDILYQFEPWWLYFYSYLGALVVMFTLKPLELDLLSSELTSQPSSSTQNSPLTIFIAQWWHSDDIIFHPDKAWACLQEWAGLYHHLKSLAILLFCWSYQNMIGMTSSFLLF